MNNSIIYILDLIGIFTFAVSGMIEASNRKFDMFGAFFIAAVTAVGGGTVRDSILGSTPVFWLKDSNYLIVIICALLFTSLFSHYILKYNIIFLIFDAIGIGVFTIIGIQKALAYDILPHFAVIMGVFTAVMGGILRDLFCNEIPLIFKKELYASSCIMGGAIYFIFSYFNMNGTLNAFITIVAIITIRLLSLKYKLSLPRFPIRK